MGTKKKIVRRKRTVTIGDNRYRAQVYISQEDRELIDKALEIIGEGSISGFAARLAIKEAKRVIAEAETQARKSAH